MPMGVAKKVVQTEIDRVLDDFVLKTAKSKGLTLKEAMCGRQRKAEASNCQRSYQGARRLA